MKKASEGNTVVSDKGTAFDTEAPHLRRDHLDNYCVSHPNKPFVLNAAGGRSKANIPDEVYSRSVPIRWQNRLEGSHCIMLSILNALWVLPVTDARVDHQDAANELYRRRGLQPIRSLHRAADFLNRNNSRYRLENAMKAKGNDRTAYDLDFVASLRQGVFLVKLTGTGNVNHCITVDGNTGLIHDAESDLMNSQNIILYEKSKILKVKS